VGGKPHKQGLSAPLPSKKTQPNFLRSGIRPMFQIRQAGADCAENHPGKPLSVICQSPRRLKLRKPIVNI
jgi:hypothetical protein